MESNKATVAIIGGGVMGGDIATAFAASNWEVHVMSRSETTRNALAARVMDGLTVLDDDTAKVSLIEAHAQLSEIPWNDVDLVIETVTESLSVKQQVFAALEELAPPEVPLASNSSSFPISQIAGALRTRARALGLHFCMPAHLVPLVEVILGNFTDKAVVDRVERTLKTIGKVPMRVAKDIPGFVVNRIQQAMMREALYLIADGVATAEDIDNAVRFGFGFRFLACGPVMQKEMSGLDTHFYTGASIYPHLHNETVPPQFLKDMVDQGRLGMKAHQGFWDWTDESVSREKANIARLLRTAVEAMKPELELCRSATLVEK